MSAENMEGPVPEVKKPTKRKRRARRRTKSSAGPDGRPAELGPEACLWPPQPGLLTLPREIQIHVLRYLGTRDLLTMRQVSTQFEMITRDPMLWKDYEVLSNEGTTAEIVNNLKLMPLLKKISVKSRGDCDDILRQISLFNKNLEELHVSNCTGTPQNLYLRPAYLTRILERCRRLHTISVLGTRFRGLKFYRMLGQAGAQLRALSATTTRGQFEEFMRHAGHIAKRDRDFIKMVRRAVARHTWAPMHYYVTERQGQPDTILISYYIDATNHACLQLQTTPDATPETYGD